MGIRTLFRKSNSRNLKAQAYEAQVAAEPPIKGSYPVAGNGPNVLEDLQRSHARRQSVSSAAPAPVVPLHRDARPQNERPRTAPHNGEPGGGYQSATPAIDFTYERTRSGFSVKSHPGFFGRRNSIGNPKAKRATWFPKAESPPPLPRDAEAYTSAQVKTYQPTRGNTTTDATDRGRTINTHVPPPVSFNPARQHARSDSRASHRSHIDILDAHSTIHATEELSHHRAEASGRREFGEDVADRNMTESRDQESRLDFNSPELSYMKQLYSPRKRAALREAAKEPHSRVDSALGHVLGSDGSSSSDDIPQRQSGPLPASAPHSPSEPRSGSRVATSYPPKSASASSHIALGKHVKPADRPSNNEPRGRIISPLASTIASTNDDTEFQIRYHNPPRGPASSRAIVSNANVTERGRPRTTSSTIEQPLPQASIPNGSPQTQTRRHNTSVSSEHTIVPGTKSRESSATYSAFPSTRDNDLSESSNVAPTSSSTKRHILQGEGVKGPPNLKGIVDLKDSVDTEVITKTRPAAVHEHVTPTIHDIREEQITRETHTHDVYHRLLPVIETEILPTKHYISSEDGKGLIEIPESMVPNYHVSGKLDQNWHISRGAICSNDIETASTTSSGSAASAPTISLARRDPNVSYPTIKASRSLRSHDRSSRSILGPFLSSKKESTAKEGHPKTEYVWRHPPVFETVGSKATQAVIPTAFEEHYYSSDEEEAVFGAERTEGDLLFNDAGYGDGGMLPGLQERSPAGMATLRESISGEASSEEARIPRVMSDVEGQATRGLRRIKEWRPKERKIV
ncbi:hypothetical protein B0O99DRAFT_595378 [Bisporella sp. PMI_857]|nr:hypothetical protein B0O99DRAFT_595378 [Bisporella sp. PMI_857]